MKHNVMVMLALVLVAGSAAAVDQYRLSMRWAQERPVSVLIEVEESPEGYTVSARDDAGRLTSRVCFDRAYRAVEATTTGVDGEVPYTVTARVDGRLDVSRAGRRTTLTAAAPYVPEGDSQYWLFSRWLAADPTFSARTVSFFDPGGGRLVGMRVRKGGSELITVGGRTVAAVRIEVSLASPVLRIFWPHVYTYWFAASDSRFLAYEGRDREGRVGRIEVVE